MDAVSQAPPAPAPSPAKGRGRKPTGKGVTKKAKKPAPPKKGTRGRGRKAKAFADPRVQAAYERQQELAALYAEVTKAAKPALEELADATIKSLLENPTAHQEVPEYEILQKQLDEQLEAALAAADRDLDLKLGAVKRTFELDTEVTHIEFHNRFNDQTEEFLDGSLNRTNVLSELRREGAPVNTPNQSYTYVQRPDEVVQQQGPYRMMRNGIEVPFPSLLEASKKTGNKGKGKGKATGKRKAEDQPESQPDAKKSALDTGASQDRNGSARDEVANVKAENGEDAATPQPRHIGGLLSAEQEADAEQGSNAQSPGVVPDEQTLMPEQDAEVAAMAIDVPDLPNGASDADAYGVRTVSRKHPKAQNRIIIPPLFEWTDEEIGFRDSANDSTRKATKATRGKFLNNPNSGTWHVDQTIVTYNCLDYGENDLDPEAVKKHNLHPQYGLFMHDSKNESEPPAEHVDGTKPVIVVTPDGHTLPASRSVRAKLMDQTLEQDAKKGTMLKMLAGFCEKEDIDAEDIVTEEMRERERSALERLAAATDDDQETTEESRDTSEETVEQMRREQANQLLHAAAYLDVERPVLPPINQRSSRPYDAVRDVFTNTEPAAPMPPSMDTFNLSMLADVSESVSHPPEPSVADHSFVADSSMIDPQLLGMPPQPPVPSNAFLQTALNPPTAYANIAPAPSQDLDLQPRGATPRNPFVSQTHVKGSPVLPPLRPSRRDKAPVIEVPRPPSRSQDFDSSRGMIQTNSGNFYPPAPARPFHQSYSVPEPVAFMPGPPPLGGPGMVHNQAAPPHMGGYPIYSPPMPGQAQLATVPVQMGPVPGPPGPPVPPMISPSPPAHTPRQRGPGSSNGNSSGKYRKIAAAPIPHNRPWPANGSTELRLAHYDHKEAIKDYRANEPPPRSGPTTIRGWNVNNVSKGRGRGGIKKEDSSEERESPKDSPNVISTYLNKWNPADQA